MGFPADEGIWGMTDSFVPTLLSAIRYLRVLVVEDEHRVVEEQTSYHGTQGRALLVLAAETLEQSMDAQDRQLSD